MPKYDFGKIEKKWRKIWQKERTYEPSLAGTAAGKLDSQKDRKPFYNLMMFPYPSAEGLHIGGVRTFTGVDIYGRMKRMQGYDVFEPMGLDGFGIHSENYALKIGVHPMKQAKVSEKRFYEQLEKIGNGFAWEEKLETYDPRYYRWTQWIFLQLWKRGLAYRRKQPVNWCPSCKTVLADEQVIQKGQGTKGVCERCETPVVRKELEQWFFKTTAYAERLLKNLDSLDWSEKVKIAQRNWIGKKEGINITYEIEGDRETVAVFTTRPDTNFGATFVVLAPENELALRIALPEKKAAVQRYVAQAEKRSEEERVAEGRRKTGVFTGRYALNHLTRKKMPIWVSDFVLSGFGTGAVVGVPGHDVRDFEFAKEFGLEVVRVVKGPDGDLSPITRVEQVQEKEGVMVNSGFLDGMNIHDATAAIMDYIEKKGWGKRITHYRLRDWLISRQRYWGPPIPIIYCRNCWEKMSGTRQVSVPSLGRGATHDRMREGIDYAVFDGKEYVIHPVLEEDLPVELPYVEDFRPQGKGESPLASVKSFYEVKCPRCKKTARRETDVSDTFLDSAWYFLRYPNIERNKEQSFVPSSGRGRTGNKLPWNPAIMKKWLPVHSYIGGAEHSVLHLLYSRFITMALNDMKLLHFEEPFAKFRAHGLITRDGTKMSKSKGNVVTPDDYFAKFGADVMRMYLAFMAPLDQGGDFREEGILGMERFLKRVWNFFSGTRQASVPKELEQLAHRTVKKVTEDIENLHYNTAISALMVLLNKMEEVNPPLSHVACSMFLKMLAPFAPFMAEEIWQTMSDKQQAFVPSSSRGAARGKFKSIHLAPWPEYDPALIVKDTFTLVIQVNGKVRDTVEGVAVNISEDEARALALSRERARAFVGGREPKNVLYVPRKVVNIVV